MYGTYYISNNKNKFLELGKLNIKGEEFLQMG